MIDLILTAVIGGTFYAGFKTGNKFKTLKEAAKAGLEHLGLK